MRFSGPTTASNCAHLLLSVVVALDLLPVGRLFELRVDLRPLAFFQLQLRQPAFLIDGHRRAIEEGALDVVDTDLVPKHRAHFSAGLLDRGAGEADRGHMR
jgi:hypothetical protein